MLKLHSKEMIPCGDCDGGIHIKRLTTNKAFIQPLRGQEVFLVKDSTIPLPDGFWGYLGFEPSVGPAKKNHYQLEPSLFYLGDGDVVKIDSAKRYLRVLYRKSSSHNAFLLTERCNNYCLMCSQPPKEQDDSFIIRDILATIPIMSKETVEVGLTGGEPTLLGDSLIAILESLKNHLPSTAVHMLSNGRAFSKMDFAKKVSQVAHPDFMIGIPIYSDISSIHDYVVQADGAFDETIRGILNLKACRVKVEIRVVIHKQTYDRLPDLATFIRRNLTFCDHVALMGLEMMGFTRSNLEKLWIDPKEYQPQLRLAVETLARANMNVSIYNHQLCLLDPSLYKFNRKSISDWKNEYMPECDGCLRMSECGGFFSSAKLRYSSYIKPFRRQENTETPQAHPAERI